MRKSQVDSFASRVLAHATDTPDRRAVVCDGQPLTYGALAERALRVAARLRSLGYEPGDNRRAGIISANDLDVVVVVTGCHFAGLTVVPIPYLIMPDAQARMLDDAGVTIVFHDEATPRLPMRPLPSRAIPRASPWFRSEAHGSTTGSRHTARSRHDSR